MESHTVYNDIDCDPRTGQWVARRLTDQPIVHAGLHESIGENIQGPSLIRVPDWIPNSLGRYYLYFADHKGRYIRLAYANDLIGPWRIHVPGALRLEDSLFPTETIEAPADHPNPAASLPGKLLHSRQYEATTPHIASPDMHVDHTEKRIYMYYHGLLSFAVQRTRLATSSDGVAFAAEEPILCPTYLRVVPNEDGYIGVHMPGVLYWMANRRGLFEDGQQFFPSDARHHALLVNRQRVYIFWTEVGEAPEHVKVSVINLNSVNKSIQISHLNSLLKPEMDWEGAQEVNEPSVRSVAYGRVNQLRDPCVFVEDGKVYLLYAGGGESAIGIAQLTWEPF